VSPHNWIGDISLAHVEILIGDANNYALPKHGFVATTLDGYPIKDMERWISTGQYDDGDSNYPSDFALLHTPGHSPGSMTLYRRPSTQYPVGIIFTGDTYASDISPQGHHHMTGFPRYGNDHHVQAETLSRLVQYYNWHIVAPGHGHPRDYRHSTSIANNDMPKKENKNENGSIRKNEMEYAQKELLDFIKRRR
jgi:glyoxylase-like metal-dependent hydrolase (beta-lactamase superfamily II)